MTRFDHPFAVVFGLLGSQRVRVQGIIFCFAVLGGLVGALLFLSSITEFLVLVMAQQIPRSFQLPLTAHPHPERRFGGTWLSYCCTGTTRPTLSGAVASFAHRGCRISCAASYWYSHSCTGSPDINAPILTYCYLRRRPPLDLSLEFLLSGEGAFVRSAAISDLRNTASSFLKKKISGLVQGRRPSWGIVSSVANPSGQTLLLNDAVLVGDCDGTASGSVQQGDGGSGGSTERDVSRRELRRRLLSGARRRPVLAIRVGAVVVAAAGRAAGTVRDFGMLGECGARHLCFLFICGLTVTLVALTDNDFCGAWASEMMYLRLESRFDASALVYTQEAYNCGGTATRQGTLIGRVMIRVLMSWRSFLRCRGVPQH